jgi:hypothetical protein
MRSLTYLNCTIEIQFGGGGASMADGFKRAPHDSLIEEAIQAKGPDYAEASARTFRTDALAILEALAAETDEDTVTAALSRQGFRSVEVYLTTFRALAAVAKSRRPPAGSAG